MLNLFAHAGHVNGSESLDHCMPVIIVASAIILALVAVIIYLLMTWQPKKTVTKSTKKTQKK